MDITINPIPTEQTTAATDVLLACAAVSGAVYLRRFRRLDTWKTGIWIGVLLSLAATAALGAVAHGFVHTDRVDDLLWSGIYLVLGACVAGFLAAALYDLRGRSLARRSLVLGLAVALAAFSAAKAMDDSFLPFILYEGAAMAIALFSYGWLALFTNTRGAGWMTIGVALTLLAAVLQGLGWGAFRLVWEFDHNGTYHLIQIVGVAAILRGLGSAYSGLAR